jgi:hypothetical protein
VLVVAEKTFPAGQAEGAYAEGLPITAFLAKENGPKQALKVIKGLSK